MYNILIFFTSFLDFMGGPTFVLASALGCCFMHNSFLVINQFISEPNSCFCDEKVLRLRDITLNTVEVFGRMA